MRDDKLLLSSIFVEYIALRMRNGSILWVPFRKMKTFGAEREKKFEQTKSPNWLLSVSQFYYCYNFQRVKYINRSWGLNNIHWSVLKGLRRGLDDTSINNISQSKICKMRLAGDDVFIHKGARSSNCDEYIECW